MSLLNYQFQEEIRGFIRVEMAANTPQVEQSQPLPVITNQKGLCEFLDLSEPTVIRWRNKGKIPFMQIGSAIRYDLNAVAKALAVNEKRKRA